MNTLPLISRNKREGRYAGTFGPWHTSRHVRAKYGSIYWSFSISNKHRSTEILDVKDDVNIFN